MSKKITITIEELEHEIKQAFVYGQGNAIMMEAGLERDEREDYVGSVMRRLNKKEDVIAEIERLIELYNKKPNFGTIDLDMFNEHFDGLLKKIKQR
tara:strand:- start:1206 stop:1493 length:288 start_codon:yes stop_codon:yes gene_type:complete